MLYFSLRLSHIAIKINIKPDLDLEAYLNSYLFKQNKTTWNILLLIVDSVWYEAFFWCTILHPIFKQYYFIFYNKIELFCFVFETVWSWINFKRHTIFSFLFFCVFFFLVNNVFFLINIICKYMHLNICFLKIHIEFSYNRSV
jgi:hypothetical protein